MPTSVTGYIHSGALCCGPLRGRLDRSDHRSREVSDDFGTSWIRSLLQLRNTDKAPCTNVPCDGKWIAAPRGSGHPRGLATNIRERRDHTGLFSENRLVRHFEARQTGEDAHVSQMRQKLVQAWDAMKPGHTGPCAASVGHVGSATSWFATMRWRASGTVEPVACSVAGIWLVAT